MFYGFYYHKYNQLVISNRGQSLVERFVQAKSDDQLVADADPKTLGQYYALVLHGLSVQARDGYSKEELAAVISFALQNLDRHLTI